MCPVALSRICRVRCCQKEVDRTRESSCLAFVLMLGFPDWVPRLSSPSEGTMLPFRIAQRVSENRHAISKCAAARGVRARQNR